MVGSRIAHYVLLRQIGSGGMGAVYEATDEQTNMRVAIKLLRPEYARNREALTRFVNEAEATNLIDHPGVVKIFGSGSLPEGTAYLVMEYLEGETLSARLRRYGGGPMPEIEVRRIGWQLASALAAAHRKKIFHRDLKPGNIMLVGEPGAPGVEKVKLLDFGIAKVDARSLNLEDPQTRSGILMGTPHYMSPEQCRGAAQVDGQADVYSLGVILFQLLTSRLPFVPNEDGEGMLLAMHIYEQPPHPRDLVPSIAEPMEKLVLDMLKKDRNERPKMGEVCTRLEEIGGSMGLPMDVSTTFEDDQSPTTKRPLVQMPPKAASTGTPTLIGAMTPQNGVQVMATLVSLPSLPAAQSNPSTPSTPSTLGGGTGQVATGSSTSLAPIPLWRRLPVLAAAGLGILVVVTTLILIRRPAIDPQDTTQTPPNGIAANPPPPSVTRHCELRSDPPGAQVVRESDHSVLGATPWKFDQPADSGPLVLLLRRDGYGERALALDCQTGPTRTERLEPLPRAQPASPKPQNQTKGKGKPKGKPKKLVKKKPTKKPAGKKPSSKVLVVE